MLLETPSKEQKGLSFPLKFGSEKPMQRPWLDRLLNVLVHTPATV